MISRKSKTNGCMYDLVNVNIVCSRTVRDYVRLSLWYSVPTELISVGWLRNRLLDAFDSIHKGWNG